MSARMKRPAFQFYPGDWQRDAALRACSIAARGLWIECLCHMHDGEPYGHLRVGGSPVTDAQLARMVGESPALVRKLLAELESAGVYGRAEDGAIYSRRMVRDEALRTTRAACGSLGGNPALTKKDKPEVKPLVNQTGNQTPTPAVAVAVAVAEEQEQVNNACRTNEPCDGSAAPALAPALRPAPSGRTPRAETVPADFLEAWHAYPRRVGTNSRADALKAWRSRVASGVTPAALLDGTRRFAAFCEATGKAGTELVMQAARFYGPGAHYAEPWDVPAPQLAAASGDGVTRGTGFRSGVQVAPLTVWR